LVDACVTDDGDALLYGAAIVYRHFSLDARNASVKAYGSKQIKSRLGLCQRSLILLGLVLGCDYWPSGVPGVGPITACKLLTQMNAGEALRRLTGAEFDTTVPAPKAVMPDSSVWRSPTWQKIVLGLSECPVTQVVDEFLSPWRTRGWQMPGDASLVWSRPDISRSVQLCVDFLDWHPAYALAQFIPLLGLWITRSASPPSYADVMQPLRIIRKRSVNYLPYLEVEWSRLKDDIWSEALETLGNSNGSLTASLRGFYTTAGYRFPVPEVEFRIAFPHLVLAFESLSLRTLTSRMDALSVNGRKGKGKQKGESHVIVTDASKCCIQDLMQVTSSKTKTATFILPSWDSSPEGSPLKPPSTRVFSPPSHCSPPFGFRSTPPMDARLLSSPAPPVENFISLRISSHFERRLTLQSSLLTATPPPSPSAGEFDGFRTPARLLDRLA
uniref:XPGI domain-containing protein n=1 Tax=Hydatigena taeniaeformis TaxID=6205 RepID=A0A0R3XAP7_HYDTA